MKFTFAKTLIAAGAFALVCSCSEDTISRVAHENRGNYIVSDTSYVYTDKNNNVYLISKYGIVSDTTGIPVGIADIATGLIIDNNSNIIAQGVNFSKLDVVTPTKVVADGWLLNMGSNYVIAQTGEVYNAQGVQVGKFVINEGTFTGNIVLLDNTMFVEGVDLLTLKAVTTDIVKPIPSSSSVVASSASQPPASSSSSSIAPPQSSSSSSSVKSSSSSAKSSSSQGSSTAGCPAIKYVSGGASGKGWATRYWDCCMPSCSWPENAHGNVAKTCTVSGGSANSGNGSVCSGGSGSTCLSQIPFTVSGCDNLAFAFAAVPASNGGMCGHCYELTFTGEGHYGTSSGAKRLSNAGKKLIVMASNIGGDVAQGQFDVMIPGGGVGQFNGCNGFGWGDQGEQYGGLLSKCETENNYNQNKYKSCLTEKCNSTFKNDAKAKEGCLFLANWMEAASNPEHTFKEVECPDVLKQKY
ncbi:MAG: glycosyl hydrolase family 5 [Fibrobacter sp.]|nr:glycosyl hydrolase family 5 [Fibrobacter sp.]